MKKLYFLFWLAISTTFCVSAQETDYVISDPAKTRQSFQRPTISDSNTVINPDYTSYFLNSTAYTLEKKKIRLSGTDIIFVKGSYGLTDNTMLSVNISLFGTFTGSVKQQLNLSENLKLGISGSMGRLLFVSIDSTTYFGGGQAMITIGDRQNNITAGTGFYYIKSSFDLFGNGEESLALNNVYVGFQKQLSKKLYLMAEGVYFINEQVFTGAIGAKLIMGNRIALNFGLMPFGWKNTGTNQLVIEPIVIPLISFRILLGRGLK